MSAPTVRADLDRATRTGEPEIVYAEGKTPHQAITAVAALRAAGVRPVVVTRADAAHMAALTERFPSMIAHPDAGVLVDGAVAIHLDEMIEPDAVIVTAGTSDLGVARECQLVLEALGEPVETIVDVGVAGLHRVLAVRDRLERARVVVVIAGMEAALAPVVAGMVSVPVVAVPTSVGYGAAQGGLTALHGLLTACAPGIAVVNIDNGLGAALLARRMLRMARRESEPLP